MMLMALSTVLSTADFAAETFMTAAFDVQPGTYADLALGVADEVADMSLTTLDEVSQYEIDWSFLKSIEVAFV